MATDVLAYNALARSIDGIRDQIAEKRRLRDSAIGALPVIDSALTEWTTCISTHAAAWTDSMGNADSDRQYAAANPAGYGFTPECWHSKFYASPQCAHGWAGIKLLCDYGSVTCDFCVMNCNGNHWQCGQSCSITIPSGVTRIGVYVQAPGGPSAMSNCCGGGSWGPMGGFASSIYCVSQGDTFLACAGCVNCCYPYCCGYQLYQSEPSYVCTCIGGAAGKIYACSPHPHLCCEMKNRICNTGCGSCNNSNVTGVCYTIWHFAECMCGSEGNSLCNNSYGQCCFQCSGPGGNDCWPLGRIQDWQWTGTTAYNGNYCGFCPVGVTGSASTTGNFVPGSCFFVQGKWYGSMYSNNCYWVCNDGTPWNRKMYNCVYQCCKCMEQCCPGCVYSANNGYERWPGQGGHPNMTCGGYTALYSDMGTFGAVRIQMC